MEGNSIYNIQSVFIFVALGMIYNLKYDFYRIDFFRYKNNLSPVFKIFN